MVGKCLARRGSAGGCGRLCPGGDFLLGLFRELRVAELAEAKDEDVLPGAAGVEEPQSVAAPPVRKPEVVELPATVI